jgi:hypothetical protein
MKINPHGNFPPHSMLSIFEDMREMDINACSYCYADIVALFTQINHLPIVIVTTLEVALDCKLL